VEHQAPKSAWSRSTAGFVARKTIEFHKHQIMAQFNLKTNADLVLFAVKEGLVSIDSEIHYGERYCEHADEQSLPALATPRR
jgi:hypothetical protein